MGFQIPHGRSSSGVGNTPIASPSGGLAAPTNIGVWPGETQASLYWRDASGGDATGFKVYRSTTQGFTPDDGTNLIHTTGVDLRDIYSGRAGYVDTGLTNDTTYYYRVKATDGSSDSSATSEISVIPKSGGTPNTSIGGGDNEPAGYSRVFEWDQGHEFPPWHKASTTGCDLVEGLVGSGIMDSSGDEHHEHFLVHDPTAPVGGPMCHEIRYAAHRDGESSSEKVWAWATPSGDECDIINQNPDSSNWYKEVYLREHRKIWTDRDDGTVEHFGTGAGFKFSHIKGDLVKQNDIRGWSFTLGPKIDTDLTFQQDFGMKFRISWTDNAGVRHADTWGTTGTPVTVGQWHEFEWQMIVNTIDGSGNANADGEVRLWVDGTLVIETTNAKMRSGISPHCEEEFQNYDQTTTWSGGPSNTHEHNKGWMTSHVYVSGVAA